MKPFCRPFLIACLVSLVAASCQSPVKPAPPAARTDGEQTGFYPEKLAEMDAAINQTITDGMIPGGVLWLERDGISYHKAYGRRAVVPASEPMTEDTIFDAASLTKSIGGAPAIMLLLERGRLQLDDLVQKHLPAFTGGGKEKVTLRHLLTHTSGLRSGLGDRSSWTGTDGAVRKACEEKLLNPPGTFFRYSDINFILLGGIAEKVAGQRLNVFLERELYRPLKMNNTSYLPAKELLPRIAPTEKVDGKVLRGEVHDPTARQMGGVAGHAGVFTTASDLARYARMLLNGGELDGVRVLKPETVKLMTSVQSPETVPARRGLGWDIDSAYSRPRGKIYPLGSYGHTGFTGTCLWIDPYSQTFWMFLSNRVHPSRDGNVLPLQAKLANMTAEAVRGFNFLYVPGALPPRASVDGPANVTAPAKTTRVLTGIDVMVRDKFAPLKGLRLGLITNHTGHDRQRNATIDLFHAAASSGVQLKALFSPEHGIRGLQDEKVADSTDTKTGLPVYSLYGERRAPAPEQLKNLDALVFDIQDVGCRFYTYIATLGNCMEVAEKAGLKFYVLDRVNPINGLAVEGPVLQGTNSFVAYHAIPLRHGMTVGELARMFQAERFPAVKLTVIPVENWTRDQWFDQATLPWTNPSPNMRSLTEAALYPGVGLLETAVSVGRGTDTPFEVVGAPYIDDVKLAEEMNQAGLPGVRFAPVRFTPKASVFKDKPCGGVNLILTDRQALRAVDVGIVLATTIQRLHPKDFALDKVNTLLQDTPTLAAIRRGGTLAEIKHLWETDLETFHLRRAKYLVYK